MSQRTARRLAWSSAALAVVLVAAGLLLSVLAAQASADRIRLAPHQFFHPLATFTFSIVGALIASRHPRNAIGWLLTGMGLVYGLGLLALGYGMVSQAVAVNTPLPGIALARWLNDWFWIPAVTIPLSLLLLLFPDGRLLSRRWRPVAWLASLGLAGTALGSALYSGDSAAGRMTPAASAAAILESGAWLLLAMGILGSVTSLVVRFRRSRGVERDQLKWLVYGVGLALLIDVVGISAAALGGPPLRKLEVPRRGSG